MPFLDSLQHWLYSQPVITKARRLSNTHGIEGLNFQVRLAISIVIFVFSVISPFLTDFHIVLHIFFPLTSILYLYLLLRNKTEYLFGLPYFLLLLVLLGVLLQKGNCYLCMLTSSLGAIAILSAQGYPPHLPVVMAGGLLFMQKHFVYQLDEVYEPITDCYRISADSLNSAITGWFMSLALEIVSLMIFQIFFKKIWDRYQKAKHDMEGVNKSLLETNILLSKKVEELEKTNRELNIALKTRQLFVACVTHEIKNPLNVLLNGIEQLVFDMKGHSQEELVKTCQMCGEAILNQVNNLLDAAKITEDKLQLNNSLTKMSDFLEKFWALTRIGLDKRELVGHLTIDKNLPLWLYIDSHRLYQILDNLVGNALKFTIRGSIRVTVYWIKGSIPKDYFDTIEQSKVENGEKLMSKTLVEFEEGSKNRAHLTKDCARRNNMSSLSDFISIKSGSSIRDTLEEALIDRTVTEDSFLRIDIVDTGCGISEEEQNGIFEPFEQANRTISKRYGGTGLGLYIVKKLVDKMGGCIKLTSLENVGTRFQVLIPVKSSDIA